MVRTYQPKKRQRSKEHGFRKGGVAGGPQGPAAAQRSAPRPDPLMGPRME